MTPYMRQVGVTAIAVFSVLTPAAAFGATLVMPENVTVGQNLQTSANIQLSEPAPSGGLQVTLTSSDPGKLLLSTSYDRSGSETISVSVRQGFSASPEFVLQGLASDGTATYTASAPGFGSRTGTVTFARSGIVIASPFGFGRRLSTGAGAAPLKINISPVLLDSSGKPGSPQQVRGGQPVVVNVTSSNTAVGTISTSPLTIAGGAVSMATEFQPVSPGETTLAVNVPRGFSAPSQYAGLSATVNGKRMLLTSTTVGENLEVAASVRLEVPAPPEGLEVILTSNDPSRLLLARYGLNAGSKSIAITVPAGGNVATFKLQGLSSSGTATYTASAAGVASSTASVTLAPSGVLLGSAGPPDEAELLYKQVADEEHGFVASVSTRPTIPVKIYVVQLDPVHHRAADVTVRSLRSGVTLTVTLKSSNPAVGTIASPIIIPGGATEGVANFKALSAGTTLVSVDTPDGFTTAGNATLLKAIVQK
jgi:hypothetical protein